MWIPSGIAEELFGNRYATDRGQAVCPGSALLTSRRFAMNRTHWLAPLVLCAAFGVQAQTTMTGKEHSAAKDLIEADYKAEAAACDRMSGNAKDICVAEAKAKEKIGKAELEHRRSGSASDARKLAMVKAEAAYEIAKERCDDLSGNDKDACVKQAKANEASAKAAAK
jgi:hypothetical protein